MKGIGLVLISAALLLTSCAATFVVRGTAPTMDNGGTCAVPNLVPTVGGLVRVRLSWTGPALGTDSTLVQPGAAFSFTRSVPSGNYTFTAVCADSLGNTSCGVSISKLVRGSFGDVPDLR